MKVMKKIKTYHIHTDFKFVNSIGRFEGGDFENFNVFISDDSKLDDSLGSDILTFKNSELDQVIRLCSSADLVVLYDLDLIKSKLALSLPKEVKIAWRFFGYELYSRDRDKYISEKTSKSLLYDGKSLIERMHSIVKRIYRHINIPGTNNYLFKKAVSKIDFFLGLSIVEYNLLNKTWKPLPSFIKLSIYPPKSNVISFDIESKKRKKRILIGNSKSSYNNHLDIFDIVDRSSNKNKFNFQLPFNYGHENSYTKKVREECVNKEYYTLIEEYMPFNKYNKFYEEVGTLVLNNYRQMAMGNIRFAFIHGVKVYLNPRNVLFEELKIKGFIVYSIGKLLDDLNTGDVYLSSEVANNNFNNLIEVSERYTSDDFQNKLLEKIL